MNVTKNSDANRKATVRTGLILASIALVFFVGVIAAHLVGTPLVSVSVIGAAVLLYLVISIGRHLRKR